MKFLRLWLLLGALFVIGHCQEEEDDGPVDVDESEQEDQEMEGEELDGEDDLGDPAYPDGDEETEEEDVWDPLTSEQMRALHKKIDANANGKVSLAEITEYAQSMRRAMAKMELDDIMKGKDTNKDGKLDFHEYLGDPGLVPEKEQNEKTFEFKELDKNNDKFVDADELASVYHHHTNEKVENDLTKFALKDKDKNHDGVLSLEEFYIHLQPEDEDEEPVEITEEDKEIFGKLDVDGTNSLSLQELIAWESGSFQAEEAVKKIFMQADKDGDSQITADELDGARHDIANHHDVDAQMYLMQWADHHAERGEL